MLRLKLPSYGTLIGNPTPGIQWYNFRPPGVTPNWGMGPPWGAFLSNYFDLLLIFEMVCLTTHVVEASCVDLFNYRTDCFCVW